MRGASVAGSDASLEEVLAGAANIEVFAVFMAPTEAFQGPFASEELFEIQPSGELFASGPLDLDVEHIAGMCILHAPSRQDASASPTRSLGHQAGRRTHTVRSWQLNEGLLTEAANTLVNSA
jgi:hypothetical protein